MRRDEQNLQIQLMRTLRVALPHGWISFHCPNGGLRSKREASLLKAMGVVPGVPDVMILGQDSEGRPATYFLELKAPKGSRTPEQISFHDRLADLGFAVATVRSLDEALAACRASSMPLRIAA